MPTAQGQSQIGFFTLDGSTMSLTSGSQSFVISYVSGDVTITGSTFQVGGVTSGTADLSAISPLQINGVTAPFEALTIDASSGICVIVVTS